jgi:hypothetical protein
MQPKGETNMEAVQNFLGSTGWIIVAFIAGTLVGAPLWNWAKTKMPWNK